MNIEINGQLLGDGQPPYIVAEISANHNGSIDRAKRIMLSAKESGADAVKLQTYTADTMTLNSGKDDFLIKGGPWGGKTLYELYKWAETPYEWHKELFEYARSIDLTCFSTPFDETAVDLLESLNTPAYKIASFEMIDLPLVKYVASTKKPMIISTGMASLDEISEVVECVRNAGCQDLILLHCISAYPAPLEQSNLLTVPDLTKRFNVLSGLSDHTLGVSASITSVALGACFIEKHFTLDRNDDGPDSKFSIEPFELSDLCKKSKEAWMSLGSAGYHKKESEIENVAFRRSIYFMKDIKKGMKVDADNIRRIRPGFGLAPKYFDLIIGKVLKHDVQKGDPVSFDDLDDLDD